MPDIDKCITFQTVIPAYFGRVYAISTEPQVDLFPSDDRTGIRDEDLVDRVTKLASPWQNPDVLVWDKPALQQWLASPLAPQAKGPRSTDATTPMLVISYGSPDYEPAATALAEALRAKGLTVKTSSLGVQNITTDPDPYYRFRSARYERPLKQIDIFIGNDWDNSNLADLTGSWMSTSFANPTLPISVNRQFPGGDRVILMLTRPFLVREGRPNKDGHFPDTWHSFTDAPRHLVIGASTPGGALRGVKALLELPQAP